MLTITAALGSTGNHIRLPMIDPLHHWRSGRQHAPITDTWKPGRIIAAAVKCVLSEARLICDVHDVNNNLLSKSLVIFQH
jgi:hypothetical protein